jgi:DNA-binding protein H-NS
LVPKFHIELISVGRRQALSVPIPVRANEAFERGKTYLPRFQCEKFRRWKDARIIRPHSSASWSGVGKMQELSVPIPLRVDQALETSKNYPWPYQSELIRHWKDARTIRPHSSASWSGVGKMQELFIPIPVRVDQALKRCKNYPSPFQCELIRRLKDARTIRPHSIASWSGVWRRQALSAPIPVQADNLSEVSKHYPAHCSVDWLLQNAVSSYSNVGKLSLSNLHVIFLSFAVCHLLLYC